MSYPGDPQQQQQPAQWSAASAPTAPAVTALPPKPGGSGKFARRALLATAGIGVCAAAVEAAPLIADRAKQYTEAELQAAVNNAIQEGRNLALQELRTLEGVSIDVALLVAGATLWATQHIFTPLANLVALIGGDALGVLASLVGTAADAASKVGVDVTFLRDLVTTLTTWRTALQALPSALGAQSTADLTNAETYLTALQTKINASASSQTASAGSTPGATPTQTP